MALFWCKYIKERMAEIESESDDGLVAEDRAEIAEVEKFVARMTGNLLGHLAGFSDSAATQIEALFRDVGHALDKEFELFYVRDMLERIPRMVSRTAKLSQIVPSRTVSKSTDICLREATRSYIFGFWDSSVALSRAALEEGLHEASSQLSDQTPQELVDLINHAAMCGLLDKPTADLAHTVRVAANRVLHRDPQTRKRLGIFSGERGKY